MSNSNPPSGGTTKDGMVEDANEKTPGGASSYSLTLNTNTIAQITDTLKDYAIKLVANAHSELSENQWSDYLNEHTALYIEALSKLLATEVERAKKAAYIEGQKAGKNNYHLGYLSKDDQYAIEREINAARIDEINRKMTLYLDIMSPADFKAGFNEALDQIDAANDKRIKELKSTSIEEKKI